ncbi:hypothetical protein K474DRAFT_1601090 [Panus rudis PR-1116 ss-1]|nr:hypothetical protein K474DRAFT_1601090 [Panus rudis PR-1116 ss-1]
MLCVHAAIVKRDPCPCPLDKFGDTGVEINTFNFFQCAYTQGTCDWSTNTGELENTAQSNCPGSAPPCPSGVDCVCPVDLNGSTGREIGIGSSVQCAYPNGACTYNTNGALMNALGQSNCPTFSGCA